jgi:hypothetical protein
VTPNYSGDNISALIQFTLIGIILFAYNEPIAKELAKLYSAPFRWFFGERSWVVTLQRYLAVWMRITLYGAVLVAVVIIILTLTDVYHLL